jgi:ParB family transcriptional regulator, chromosome partitioning protein
MAMTDKAERLSTDGPAAEWVDPKVLRPWKRNPRKNDDAVDRVAASIQRFGFGSPLVARLANREVVSGHTRLKAALKLGLQRIPVRFVDLSEADAHALAIADNRLSEFAEWDDELLAEEREHLDDDIAALLDDVAQDEDGSREPMSVEAVDVSELTEATFWMTVRGPLPKQPDAIEKLRAALQSLGPDIEVELGGLA